MKIDIFSMKPKKEDKEEKTNVIKCIFFWDCEITKSFQLILINFIVMIIIVLCEFYISLS